MLQSRIRRGELDKQVILIKKTIGTAASNADNLDGWEKVDEDPVVWAKIVQRQGSEVVVADQIQSVVNTTVTIDYRTDISAENRVVIVDDLSVLNIISVSRHADSRNGFLIISSDVVPNLISTITA